MSSYNLADLFESIVDHFGGDEALLTEERSYTYTQLEEDSNRIAHALKAQGIVAKDHIGIYAYNRAEWLIATLAAFKIRAVPININYRYTAKELLYIADNADLKALVYEQQFTPKVHEIRPDTPLLKAFISISDDTPPADKPVKEALRWEEIIKSKDTQRDFEKRSNEDYYILYTGGTTGYPKGVVWHSEDIFFAALQGGNPGGEPISSPEELPAVAKAGMRLRALVCPPLMHGGGLWTSLISLLSAGSIVLYTAKHFDPARVLSMAERSKALSLMIIGDAMALPIADELERKSYKLDSLVTVGSGGALLSPAIKERISKALPNLFIMDSFGASETGSMGTALGQKTESGAASFLMPDHVSVVDEQCVPIEPGSPQMGYLARSGRVPLGYYKDKEKSAQTMRTDANGKRWVILGDCARVLADGSVELLGRDSVCINSGGEKIFSEEVEMAVKTHPHVADAVIVPTPNERFGQQVSAVVKLKANGALDLAALQQHLKDHIASYKHPRVLFLVNEVPRTPSSKADYPTAKKLAEKLLESADSAASTITAS